MIKSNNPISKADICEAIYKQELYSLLKILNEQTYKTSSFKIYSTRFAHLNVYIIGPLPPYKRMRYCLMRIDRLSRWPEGFPIPEITADEILQLH